MDKCEIWCENCDNKQEVEIHSIEVDDTRLAKVAYTCFHCRKLQITEYVPKGKKE